MTFLPMTTVGLAGSLIGELSRTALMPSSLTLTLYLVSTSEINIIETKNALQHDISPKLRFGPIAFI